MGTLYNYEYYHNCCGPIAYEDPAHWVEFFGNVAEHIVKDFHPKTVLDAGCAMGYLVAALRDRNVEAYGIDISDYAISKVREDIKPYCIVGSLTEPLPQSLPQHYDLVVTVEVLEHLYAEDGRTAIHNLCALSDQVIFTSTPNDFTEHTHVNVQQREYWARIFAEEGFFDDINYRPTYLTYYASCFRKSTNWLRQIEDYERNIRLSEAAHSRSISEWQQAVNDKEVHIQNQISMLADKEQHIQNQSSMLETIRQQCEELKVQYAAALQETAYKEGDLQRLEVAHSEALLYWQTETETAKHQCEELKIQYAAALQEAADKEGDLQRLEVAHSEALQYWQTEIETARQQCEDLKAQYTAALEEVKKRESDIQQLRLACSADRFQWWTEASEYEDIIQDLNRLLDAEKVLYQTNEEKLWRVEQDYANLEKELSHYKEHYFAAIHQREDLKAQLAYAEYAYNVISNAFFWKITKPVRVVLDAIKTVLRNNYYTHLFCKGLKCWKENGSAYTWKKVQDKMHHRQNFLQVTKPPFTSEELEKQRMDVFPINIQFSILVPIYNTPEQFLHEMIQSVLDQTYGNWELCLADGSDEEHHSVEKICRQYAKKDRRIRYQKLEKNLGISENTNACIDMSSGDYIALFDHDDLLHPAALHEVMKAICEKGADFIYTDENTFRNKPEDAYCPHFKPDYAPDTLRSYNYICHLSVFSKELLRKVGGRFRQEFDGSQDYDMVLRLTEQAEHIIHIPQILYYWRCHKDSVASDISAKPYTITAAKRALAAHLERIKLDGVVEDSKIPSTYRIQYNIEGHPLVSILIPNKDHIEDLERCILSIKERTTYPSWEIIVIENNSTLDETFAFYSELEKDERIRVVYWEKHFNYSAINNFGTQYAQGEYFLLLNNDTKIITPDWIEQMLMFCQRKDVGAVGAMLYYPDDTIQHAGVVVGLGGVAGHSHKYFNRGHYGYSYRLTLAQNLTAVTAACIMIRRDVWNKVGGLDEAFEVAFNDVDLCMRIRQAGYLIVWTPYAELYHYESKSRGAEDTPEKQQRFQTEIQRFQSQWAAELAAGDPYYNPNLTLDREDFSLR